MGMLRKAADQFKGFTVTHRGNTKSVVYFEAIKTETPPQTDMPEK